MPQPCFDHILSFASTGYHKIQYVEWGDHRSKKVAVCVHGLSRNGRDFDYLAKELVDLGYRVICPDMPGRGKSDWLPNPEDYSYPKHINEIMALLARLNVESVDWIGTSMGGLIGMILASFQGSPIRKLVINDVGPEISAQPLLRIKQYLSLNPTFKTPESARNFLKQLLVPFGPITEDQLSHLCDHGFFTNSFGELQLAYDPNILENFKTEDVDLWGLWENITNPVLLIRGIDSEVLSKKTAEKMMEKPNVTFVQIPDTAHAPSLMAPDQIESIVTWLEG